MRIACPLCHKVFGGVKVRLHQILGSQPLDQLLDLQALSPKQRADVIFRSKYCSDVCAQTAKVENALKKPE